MLTTSPTAAPAAATFPQFPRTPAPDKVTGLFEAATSLAQLLGQGRALDSRAMRSAMEAAFGASDAEGSWVWKDAHEASEAAQFCPVATDVKGEKRFLSTIARRLDTLGAITRGQRQTGGQGLFRADDNLESAYSKAALRQFYQLLYAGKVDGCSLAAFEDATGLALCDQDGSLREDLPPITQFLDRILALRIDLQNTLFATFEELLEARIEGALAAGSCLPILPGRIGVRRIRRNSRRYGRQKLHASRNSPRARSISSPACCC
jgi:hypothetical protein